MEAEIRDLGGVQVTPYGEGATQCKSIALFGDGALVKCASPNGVATDSYFTVMLHS